MIKNTDPTSDASFRKILKAEGFITRDARVKERKKYGLKKHVVHHNFQNVNMLLQNQACSWFFFVLTYFIQHNKLLFS